MTRANVHPYALDLFGHLTFAALAEADDARALLESLGCTVPHWDRDDDQAESGLVEFPDRGWSPVLLRFWQVAYKRGALLHNLFTDGSRVSATYDDAIQDLADSMHADNILLPEYSGLLLRILQDLRTADPERCHRHETLIALRHPDALTALAEHAAYLDNTAEDTYHARYEQAVRLVEEAAGRIWPEVGEGEEFCTEQMLAAFLRIPHLQWSPERTAQFLRAQAQIRGSETRSMLKRFVAPRADDATFDPDEYDIANPAVRDLYG